MRGRSIRWSRAAATGRKRPGRGPCYERASTIWRARTAWRHWGFEVPSAARTFGGSLTTTSFRFAGLTAACLLWAAAAGAQTSSTTTTTQATQPSSSSSSESRPATTTFFGDTGLWFVPTAEVLGHGKWSVSGYRRGTDSVRGYTNVGDFAGTFGVGLGDRAWSSLDRSCSTRASTEDVRPLFIATTRPSAASSIGIPA